MTHKEQMMAILDEAGLDWGHSGGDSLIIEGHTRFRFSLSGKLEEVSSEGGCEDDY